MATLPIRSVTRPMVLSGQANGKLSASILVDTPGQAEGPTVRLVGPAARAWRAMCAVAARAGHVLKSTSLHDSYRPYEVQARIFRQRYSQVGWNTGLWWDGSYWFKLADFATAAVPGTSNHGWALAVDIGEEKDGDSGTESIDSATLAWLIEHADEHGFSAELQSEPWHWRYTTGDAIPAAVIAYEEEADMTTLDDTFDRGDGGLTSYANGIRDTVRALRRIEPKLASLAAPQVDATAVAAALARNADFLAAIARVGITPEQVDEIAAAAGAGAKHALDGATVTSTIDAPE